MDKTLLVVAILLVSAYADSQIATLYALDPVARTLSFTSGQYGLVMQGNGVYNYDSQIDYSWYNTGALTVGVQGNEQGVIVDLGTQDDLASRYSYYETVGKGQGFASIEFQSANSNQLMIRTQNSGLQPLNESSLLANVANQAFWVPVVDHVALVKVQDSYSETVVKMIVLAVNSDYVTFRYEVLRSNVTANPTPASDPNIKTLYAYDPTMRTLSFSTGQPGHCFCGYTQECDYCAVCNCYSDLDYNWYALNSLSSGIEGGRLATWVDLGTESDLQTAYPNAYYPFPSIRFTSNISHVIEIGDSGSTYTLNARNETTDLYKNGTSSASQSITVGNYYLVRLTDFWDPTFERVALLKVLHHSPSVGVTVRYQLLRDTDPDTVFPDNAGNRTFVATLYAKDPITHSYDLDYNRGGAVFNSGGVYNLNSMIEFDNYLQGTISSGVQGGQLAVLLDIGTETAIRAAYLPDQLYNPWTEIFYNSTFRSLYYVTPTSNINLNENTVFFASATSSGYISLNVYEGHIYLLRLYDTYDPTFERIYKILVLKYVPNEELTIRALWLDRDDPLLAGGITTGSAIVGVTSGSVGAATTGVGLSVTTADLNATLASSSDASVIELCFMLALLIALLA